MGEVFKTLSAFSPGRIDYGVGRAPGGDNFSIYALSEGREPMVHNMYEKFDTTLELINDVVPTDRLYNKNIARSEEHTSELQSRGHLVCRLLLEKKKHYKK